MRRIRPTSADHRPGQEGTALILALFFSITALGIVFVGTLISRTNRTNTLTAFRLNSQADQFARAGMTEAMSWFRRQTSQPAVAFSPAVDTSLNPPVFDTAEPEIGLVREFEIEGKIWGRYEVWREWADDPDPERLAWRRQMQARDVSPERGVPGDGFVWRLRSIGYVFSREDANLKFAERPNRVVAVQILESEIVRRRIMPPGQAALSVGDGNSAHVNTYGRIIGGGDGAGIYYPAGTGTPTVGPKRQQRVTGTPPLSPSTETVDLSPMGVFGLSANELRGSADQVVVDRRDFPVPVPDFQTVFFSGSSISFDDEMPLQGKGIVYIDGNATILPGSNSYFEGILYVNGNLDVRAPAEIVGAVIVTGNFTIQGSEPYATLRYSDEVLRELRENAGPYRFLGAFRPVHWSY